MLGTSWLPCFGDTTCLLGGVTTHFHAALGLAKACCFVSKRDLAGFGRIFGVGKKSIRWFRRLMGK